MIDFHEPLLFGKLTRKINAIIRAQSPQVVREFPIHEAES